MQTTETTARDKTDADVTKVGLRDLRSSLAADKATSVLFICVNLAVFFALWEVLARRQILSPTFFPAPTGVVTALIDGFNDGSLWVNVLSSAKNFVIGLALSCVIAIPLGMLLGAIRPLDRTFSPYVWAMAAMPSVALVPLVILIFGFTDKSKIVLILLNAVFPIAINCMSAVKTIDPMLLSAGRVFGAKRRHLYAKIVLPASAPMVISGVNLGITQSLIGLVVAEMFATDRGLGHVMVRAQQNFEAGLLYGVMVILIVISLTFVGIMRAVEKWIAPWQREQQP